MIGARSLPSTLAALLLSLAACSDSAQDQDSGVSNSVLDAGLGLVSAELCPTLEPVCGVSQAPSYANEVVPIIQRSCANAVGCHTGKAGDPWPLNDYEELADWSHSLIIDVQECSMPPPDSGVALTLQERMTLWQWLNCGTPEN